jgi:hypothetical protein
LEIASIIRTRSRIRAKIHTAELSQHDAFWVFFTLPITRLINSSINYHYCNKHHYRNHYRGNNYNVFL